MRLAVGLPTDHVERRDEFLDGGAVTDMARHAEAAGVDAVFVTDHPAPDDRWLAGGGHHALEPTVALSFAAAATTRLRVLTNIYVLAYRNPLLAATTLASLDVLSGGRLTVGVAAGYLRPEFRALGADFDGRNDALDESIGVLRAAWTGESFAGEGSGWSTRGTTILPRPTQQPGPPIWCGGNSRRAIDRAVTLGDGWMPFPTPPGLSSAARTAEIASLDDLAARLALLDERCAEHERADRPTVCFAPFSSPADGQRFVDELGRLRELGVDWLALPLGFGPGGPPSRAAWCDAASEAAALVRSG